MQKNIFREYDIRGIVDKDLTIDGCYNLGKAIVTYLHELHPASRSVIVGRDGRLHSPAIHAEIVRAITTLGFDVVDIGMCPTPVVYFATQYLNIPMALMISASHNPGEYNGIKIWGVAGTQITAIKELFFGGQFLPDAEQPGAIACNDISSIYLDYLENQFAHLKGLAMPFLVDCGNGAGGMVMPELIKRMSWKNAQLLYAEVDGTFPNHEPDPTVAAQMHEMARMLTTDKTFAVGIGLDGDCDRMDPMTSDGYLVPGDHLLALFATEILKNNPGSTVVCDIKSSGSLIDMLANIGAQARVAPSGHSLIKKAMKETGALLAGELSCHFFFHDRYFGYDDGIYAALRLLELLHLSGKSLQELLASIPQKVSSPEFRIACKNDTEKLLIVAAVKDIFCQRTDIELITIDGIRAHMSYGWGLLRASNTQPVISLRFESNDADGLARVKKDFYTLLQPYFDEHFLRNEIEL